MAQKEIFQENEQRKTKKNCVPTWSCSPTNTLSETKPHSKLLTEILTMFSKAWSPALASAMVWILFQRCFDFSPETKNAITFWQITTSKFQVEVYNDLLTVLSQCTHNKTQAEYDNAYLALHQEFCAEVQKSGHSYRVKYI